MAVPNVYSLTNADEVANENFESLTEGVVFTLPSIDLNDPKYDFTIDPDDPIYQILPRLSEDDLTSREVNGTGIFDGIMEAINAHLQLQHEKGWITGEQYAKVYLEATLGALGNAVQYLLGKDQAYYSGVLAQAQARRAMVEAVSALVQLDTLKVELATAGVKAESLKADYALTKMKLATEDTAFALGKTQEETARYALTNIMPEELNKLRADTELIGRQGQKVEKEVDIADYQLVTMLPIEARKLETETHILDSQNQKLEYEIINILPKEVDKLIGEIALIQANSSKVSADREGVIYNTTNILPAQKLNIEAETNVKTYQYTDLLPAQKENTAADTLIKEYNRITLLPVQTQLTQEQLEAKRAETLDTRTDGITVVGSIGKQKALYTQQIDSYQRDAEMKAAKMFMDTWVVRKQIDEGTSAFAAIQDTSLNTIMAKVKLNNGLT